MASFGQLIVIVNPWVWGFEGMIHRFEVPAIGINVYDISDITKEHCSFIAWSFLVYRVFNILCQSLCIIEESI